MSSYASAHVTVQKPDLFSVAVQRGDLPMSGCRFCKRTIFFNGATWQHKDDKNECGLPHKPLPLGGKKIVQYKIQVGFWASKTETKSYETDTFACEWCGEEVGYKCLEPGSVYYGDILNKDGRMLNSSYRKCPGAVGTPAVT